MKADPCELRNHAGNAALTKRLRAELEAVAKAVDFPLPEESQ